jgi:putative oxidoreductase
MQIPLSTQNQLRVIAPIPLRLIAGYGFVAHGLAKLTRGPDVFAGILHAMGVPQPHIMAWLTIVIELVGGAAVLLGAWVAFASIPLAAVLFVAMLKVHLPYGFSSIKLLAIIPAGAQFGPPGSKSTCCISRVSWLSS